MDSVNTVSRRRDTSKVSPVLRALRLRFSHSILSHKYFKQFFFYFANCINQIVVN